MRTDAEPEDDDAPYVCPGCYAVGGEPCLPGCIDAEIEADRERSRDDGEESGDGFFWDDDPNAPADTAFLGPPDRTALDVPDPLERAASELDHAEERLRQVSERFESSLSDKERAILERWRQKQPPSTEPKDTDADVDQELERLRVAMLAARLGARSEVWRDEVFCAECLARLPILVEAPPGLQQLGRLSSVARLNCSCGMQVEVAYSWSERKVTGVRFQRRIPHGVVLPYEPEENDPGR